MYVCLLIKNKKSTKIQCNNIGKRYYRTIKNTVSKNISTKVWNGLNLSLILQDINGFKIIFKW